MKASRQVKRLISKLRRRYGKRTGVVPSPILEGADYLQATDKRERAWRHATDAKLKGTQ